MAKAESFKSPKLPAPIGPYSQAIKFSAGSMVYVAGMTSMNGDNELVGEGDVKAQARQCIENVAAALEAAGAGLEDVVAAALEAAGAGLEDVVRTTVYLLDIADFADVNGVYAEYFKEPYPARVAFQAAALPRKEFLVEIDAIAAVP